MPPSSILLFRQGKVRALVVVGSERRLAQHLQVPTITELGMPALDVPGWTGVAVRFGAP